MTPGKPSNPVPLRAQTGFRPQSVWQVVDALGVREPTGATQSAANNYFRQYAKQIHFTARGIRSAGGDAISGPCREAGTGAGLGGGIAAASPVVAQCRGDSAAQATHRHAAVGQSLVGAIAAGDRPFADAAN